MKLEAQVTGVKALFAVRTEGLSTDKLAGVEVFVAAAQNESAVAALADVALPCNSVYEQEGTLVNWYGRLQRTWPSVPAPRGDAAPGWSWAARILDGLGGAGPNERRGGVRGAGAEVTASAGPDLRLRRRGRHGAGGADAARVAGARAAAACGSALHPRPADHAHGHEGGRRSLRRFALMSTPDASLASQDFGPVVAVKPVYGRWLAGAVAGWGGFLVFLFAMSWVFLALTRLFIWIGSLFPWELGLSAALGTIVSLILVLVMITATLLTMADRKWSALMQDRVGPNRARLPIPGLSHMPLKGIPHIVADVLKMLFKEDFIPEGAAGNKFLFNLAPLLAFAPAFMLFAVVPVSPELTFWGARMQLRWRGWTWACSTSSRSPPSRCTARRSRAGPPTTSSRSWAACAPPRSSSPTR